MFTINDGIGQLGRATRAKGNANRTSTPGNKTIAGFAIMNMFGDGALIGSIVKRNRTCLFLTGIAEGVRILTVVCGGVNDEN